MKRWIVVLIAFAILAIGFSLGFFAARSNPHASEQVDIPETSALIRIARQRPYFIVPHESLTDNEWDNLFETQKQISHNPTVLHRAAESLPELKAESGRSGTA